jgi:multiple sugar transport system substrate-binding protein
MSKRTLLALLLLTTLGLSLSGVTVHAQDVELHWRTRPDNPAESYLYQSISDAIDQSWDGVTLKYEPGASEGADYNSSLLSELSAGTAPDVFWIPGASLGTFVQSGGIANLDSTVQNNRFDLSVFYPQQVSALTFNPATRTNDGAVWGFPRDVSPFALYFNKDLFDEAGVDYPTQQLQAGQWDWDAFKKTAEAIHSLSKDVYGFGMNAWWGSWSMWVNMAGGSYFTADRSACTLNTPQVATALNYLAGMYKEGVGVPYGTDSEQPFVAGKLGMYLNGRWATPNNLQNLKFNWDAAEVPAGPNGQSNWLFWGAYVMNAKTAHPAEAFELMTKLVSSDVQFQLVQAGANLPSLKSNDALQAFIDSTPQLNQSAWVNPLQKYALAEAPLWGGNFDDLDNKVVEPAVTKVLNGSLTANNFARSICNQVNPYFKGS